MNVTVVVRGVNGKAGLREYAEARIDEALRRYARRIERVDARIEDETGPSKDRKDKLCSIRLKLTHGELYVRELGDDFYATIDVALGRARAALSRRIGRRKRGVGAG